MIGLRRGWGDFVVVMKKEIVHFSDTRGGGVWLQDYEILHIAVNDLFYL